MGLKILKRMFFILLHHRIQDLHFNESFELLLNIYSVITLALDFGNISHAFFSLLSRVQN